MADKNTFIYYDPPYRPLNKTSYFNSYTKEFFNDMEQYRLKNLFDKINSIGAFEMQSNCDPTNYNSDDMFFDNLYSEYNIYRIDAKRVINSVASKRNAIREILITNYND